jgi:hypothetical protein
MGGLEASVRDLCGRVIGTGGGGAPATHATWGR